MITTEEAASAPLASFHTSVETVEPVTMSLHNVELAPVPLITANSSSPRQDMTTLPAPQFPTEEEYVPPTPLKAARLQHLLRRYPDSDKVDYVIRGLVEGFALEYEGPFKFRAPANLPSASQDPRLIRDKLAKEISLGRMLGPFDTPPLSNLMCSPVGLVPKKNSEEMRMIMHLSYPYGTSVNDFIDPDKTTTKYQKFDDAISLVIREGRFCWLAKGDIKSAFKLAPIRYQDLACSGNSI